MNKLLILAEDARDYAPIVTEAALPQLEIVSASGCEEALAMIADCNILLGQPRLIGPVLQYANQLKWVQSSWAGVESLCTPDLRRDYVLTGVKDIFGPMISEYVLTYLFALERRIFEMRDNQFKKHWQPKPHRQSKDITLGIIGLGSIGKYLACSAKDFGLKVIGLNRSGDTCEGVDRVFTEASIEQFLAEVDYLVLILPDTPKTRHFVNADLLAMMKSSAVLINVGRGSIVNENDLVTALQDGQIGAAVLDVFETEPLPAQSPLWGLPNVYVTPHFAAASFPEDVVAIFVENYGKFIQDRPLLHMIDFDRGY